MRFRNIVLLSLLAVGCGSNTESESSLQTNSSGGDAAEEEPAIAAVTLPDPVVTVTPPEPVEPPVTVEEQGTQDEGSADGPQNMDEGLAALGAAMAAAQGAQGATPCEEAYNGAMAMVAALQAQPGGTPPNANLPSQADFLSGCNALPLEAQQCMTMSHAMANQATCSAVMQSAEVQVFRNSLRRP